MEKQRKAMGSLEERKIKEKQREVWWKPREVFGVQEYWERREEDGESIRTGLMG